MMDGEDNPAAAGGEPLCLTVTELLLLGSAPENSCDTTNWGAWAQMAATKWQGDF